MLAPDLGKSKATRTRRFAGLSRCYTVAAVMTTGEIIRRRPGQAALLLLALCFWLNVMSRGLQESFPVFVLPLSADFGWSRTQVSGVYAISFLVSGVLGPVVGWLFDRWGPLRLFLLGVATCLAATLAAAMAQNLWQIYASLGLLLGFGVGCLGIVPAAALLSRWFRGRLNVALAVVQSAYGVGMLIMAPAAQYLIDWRDWRAAYVVFAIAFLALLPLILFTNWPRMMVGHPDYRPATTPGDKAADASHMTLARALRHPAFWGIVWSFNFTGVGMYSVSLQTPAYLVAVGYTPRQAAEAFGLIGLLMPIGLIGFGWFADRIRRQYAILSSYVLSITAIALLLTLSSGPSPVRLAVFVLLFGCTFGARGPALLTVGAMVFRGPHLGKIYGFITIGMFGGGAIGAWAGGLLHDLTGGDQVGFSLGIGALVLAALPWLFVRAMARS